MTIRGKVLELLQSGFARADGKTIDSYTIRIRPTSFYCGNDGVMVYITPSTDQFYVQDGAMMGITTFIRYPNRYIINFATEPLRNPIICDLCQQHILAYLTTDWRLKFSNKYKLPILINKRNQTLLLNSPGKRIKNFGSDSAPSVAQPLSNRIYKSLSFKPRPHENLIAPNRLSAHITPRLIASHAGTFDPDSKLVHLLPNQ